MGTTDGAVGDAATASTPSRLRRLRPALGYLLAAACLLWVFHDVHPGRLWGHLAGINWWWVALAVACDVLGYVCQGVRWRLLLRPLGRVTTAEATRAVYVGLFANEVLPMKFGELARAYLVARWLRAGIAEVVPSMLVERFMDGVWLALAVALAALSVPLPGDVLGAGEILGAIMLFATVLFVAALLRKAPGGGEAKPLDRRDAEGSSNRTQPFAMKRHSGRGLLGTVGGALDGLARGVRTIGLTPQTYVAFALSLPLLLLQGLAFWLVMLAYGLGLPFLSGVVVFLIVHLCTAVPNAPANVGTYQFFTVLGLTIFGVEKTQAAGFSAVVFALLTAPLWLIGFWSLRRTGTTLYALRREIEDVLRRRKRPKGG